MFTIKQGNTSKLYLKWFDHVEKKTLEALKEQDCKLLGEGKRNVVFSTKGTYIAVCEPKGVRILVGSNLSEKGFYSH